jgi:hypothetical protein
MLQGPVRVRSSRHAATRLWVLMATDLMTVIWMDAAGPWLDRTSPLTATATLGGHHLVVLVIAAVGFVMLATLALLTEGFTKSSPRLTLATNVACIVSVVALTGLIALVLAALLSRLVFGRLRP